MNQYPRVKNLFIFGSEEIYIGSTTTNATKVVISQTKAITNRIRRYITRPSTVAIRRGVGCISAFICLFIRSFLQALSYFKSDPPKRGCTSSPIQRVRGPDSPGSVSWGSVLPPASDALRPCPGRSCGRRVFEQTHIASKGELYSVADHKQPIQMNRSNTLLTHRVPRGGHQVHPIGNG